MKPRDPNPPKRKGVRTKTGAYYVSIRNYERKLLRETLAAFEQNATYAAAALGLPFNTFRLRALYLGGVFPDHPAREPPGRFDNKIRKRLRAEGIGLRKRRKKKPNVQRDGQHPPGRVSADANSKEGSGGGGSEAPPAAHDGQDRGK